MTQAPPPSDRRQFLRMTAGLSITALLAACGDGTSSDDAIAVVPAPGTGATAAAPSTHPLNLALNLAYLGAQYYGYAARGAGLPANLTGGVGQLGTVTGARQASFGDALVAAFAKELADDKQRHVEALRTRLGPLAAAQPVLDLSTGSTSAFSIAAQGAGIVRAGSAFDPYADNTKFLLGAFLVENAVAAAYRTLLTQTEDPTIADHLGDAIYHGGLIRALLDDKAAADPSIDTALTNAGALFASLDGSDIGDQSLAGASGLSSNILDGEGRPIPFTRAAPQILKSLYLSSTGIGGFMPSGANGVTA